MSLACWSRLVVGVDSGSFGSGVVSGVGFGSFGVEDRFWFKLVMFIDLKLICLF